MKQLTFIRRGKLEWQDVPEPRLASGVDAIVRPTIAARCDLDFAVIMGAVPLFEGPFPIGHEFVGEIVAVGDGVRNFKAGQIVVVPCNINCGDCARCAKQLTGRCHTSEEGSYGVPARFGGGWGGALSDLVRVPYADAMLLAVPDGVDPASLASLGDNVGDGYRTVAPHLEKDATQPVLIVGGVAVGLYAAGIARALGSPRVDYMDTNPANLALAERAGANPIDAGLDAPVRDHYPITVDASGRVQGTAYALRSLDAGGDCTSASMHFSNEVPLPFMDMYQIDATLKVSKAHSRAEAGRALELILKTGFDPGLFNDRTIDWADAAKGYRERTTKLLVRRE